MRTSSPGHRGEMLLRGARGYTMIELVVSLSIMSVLLGSMVLTIWVAAGSIDDVSSPVARITSANDVLEEITSELRLALSFNERTPHSASFTVPDRDDDGLRETIRYAWSGVPGDPVSREYNGGRAVAIVEDVHHFDLTYLLKTVRPSPG